jgi:SAM-dependent methyltransferase
MREQVASWARALRRAISRGAPVAVSGSVAATDASPESPGDEAETDLPPEGLRFRVGGSSDPERFRDVGRRSVRAIEGGLALLDRRVGECERVLDFGCGCGRTLIAFGEQYPLDRFHATDIDAEAVGWCCDHLPLATCGVNEALPPLPYPDDYFDLIYAVSVFTHLDEERQFRWLTELRRICKPGGAAIVSLHGDRCVQHMVPTKADQVREEGILFDVSDGFKGMYPEWYQMTFHSEDYVREQFAEFFAVVGYLPRAIDYQDIVVLQKVAR